MYLNRLSNEQKELFLDLCIHAAGSNKDFSADQKLMIDQYCDEMNITVRYEEKTSVPELTDKLTKISAPEELRMILIETVSLLLSDNEIDEQEKAFMNVVTEKLGLSSGDVDEVSALLREVTEIYGKLNDFIFR